MNKLEVLKRIGKVALKVAGAGGDGEKGKRLEAEKELLELRGVIARQALEDVRRLARQSVDHEAENDRTPNRVLVRLEEIIKEAGEALEVLAVGDDSRGVQDPVIDARD